MTQQSGTIDYRDQLERELVHQRAVESLLPTRSVMLENIPIDAIRANPFQVSLPPSNLVALAHAIRDSGLTMSLRVRPDPSQPGHYQLMHGATLLQAARAAELRFIPCEVAAYTDEELLEIGLMENLKHHPMEPLEEAFALRSILEQSDSNIDQLARRIGKDSQHILQRLRLLEQPELPTANTLGNLAAPAVTHQPLRMRSAARRGNVYDPAQYSVEEHMHVLRTILAHWQRLVQRGGTVQNDVLTYLDELVSEVQRLERGRPR